VDIQDSVRHVPTNVSGLPTKNVRYAEQVLTW